MDLQITNSMDVQLITELKSLNATMSRAQRELASGKRVLTASDSPADVRNIIQNQADQARVSQTISNLNTLDSEVGMANSVLENAAKLLDQARMIAGQGASTTSSTATRATLAGQIQDIETQIVGIANSTSSGRYLFGGDADMVQPYSIDFANTPPFTANSTASATRVGLDAMGNSFPLSMTATAIFDSPTAANNILQSLEDLRQGLLTDSNTAIMAANDKLITAANHMSSVQAFYGNVQSAVSAASDTAQRMQLTLQTQEGQLTDADLTEVITSEQTAQTQRQAVLQMRANLPRGSLFDLLG